MEQFIMKGGNPLVGEVTISGAKNAALGILAASILTDEDVLIENLPDVRDINVFLEAVSEIGAMVDRIDRHTVRINAKGIHAIHVDDEYIRRIRASYYFIGALLGKYKSAQVPLPGGCNIDDMRFFRRILDDRLALCQRRCHHDIDRRADRHHIQINMGTN